MKTKMAFSFASKTLKLATAFALLSLGIDASATTTVGNLSVSATVPPSCIITTTAVSFGIYNPIDVNQSTDLNGTGSVTVTCSTGLAPVITLGQGGAPEGTSADALPLRQMVSGNARLKYRLYQDSARTTVWGNTAGTGLGYSSNGTAYTATVYGTIAAGQNVASGNYLDTVVATVTF